RADAVREVGRGDRARGSAAPRRHDHRASAHRRTGDADARPAGAGQGTRIRAEHGRPGMSASLDPLIARWKQYLRYDPTHWLLETDDPSIQLWYQLDIAHRPEDAAAVLETRERVLYSDA